MGLCCCLHESACMSHISLALNHLTTFYAQNLCHILLLQGTLIDLKYNPCSCTSALILFFMMDVERSNGAVKTAFDIQVKRKPGPGRPKMTWKQLTERDRREWKLSAIHPHDRDTWRSGVRSAMCAVAWKGAHCCGYGPYTCILIKNLMMMMMMTIHHTGYPETTNTTEHNKHY